MVAQAIGRLRNHQDTLLQFTEAELATSIAADDTFQEKWTTLARDLTTDIAIALADQAYLRGLLQTHCDTSIAGLLQEEEVEELMDYDDEPEVEPATTTASTPALVSTVPVPAAASAPTPVTNSSEVAAMRAAFMAQAMAAFEAAQSEGTVAAVPVAYKVSEVSPNQSDVSVHALSVDTEPAPVVSADVAARRINAVQQMLLRRQLMPVAADSAYEPARSAEFRLAS